MVGAPEDSSAICILGTDRQGLSMIVLLGRKAKPIRASSESHTVPRQCRVVGGPPVRGSQTGGGSWAAMGYQRQLCLCPLYRVDMF